MNWEETVMNEDTAIDEYNNPADDHAIGCVNIAKAQAEISFKAGRELILEEHGKIYLEGKQVGIREVVEWIENSFSKGSLELGVMTLTAEWQAKLKEQRIE